MSTDVASTPKDEIEDVQNIVDNRHIAIDKVGIKDIKHPIKVSDRTSGEHRCGLVAESAFL